MRNLSEIELAPHFPIFKGKTLVALDYGSKSVGVALYEVGSPIGPGPKEAIENTPKLKEKVHSFLTEYEADLVICGIPLLLDGEVTPSSHKAYLFAQELGLAGTYLQDETLSTQEAKERLQNSSHQKLTKGMLDSWSAVIILEDFLFAPRHFTLLENPWRKKLIEKGLKL